MKSWVTEDEGDEEEVAVVAAAVQGAVQVAALDASSKSSMLQLNPDRWKHALSPRKRIVADTPHNPTVFKYLTQRRFSSQPRQWSNVCQ
jgi:hypothetical protein